MSFSKVICVVDEDVDVQDIGQVAWRLLANLDPKRDFAFVDGPIDQLDHGANQALWGSKVCIDGTRKWNEEGYKRDWPEPCRMSAEVSARVDRLWPELGLERWMGGLPPALAASKGLPARGRDVDVTLTRGAEANGVASGGAIARVLAAARDLLQRGRS